MSRNVTSWNIYSEKSHNKRKKIMSSAQEATPLNVLTHSHRFSITIKMERLLSVKIEDQNRRNLMVFDN